MGSARRLSNHLPPICSRLLPGELPFRYQRDYEGSRAKDKRTEAKPVELAVYCGLYWGACDIYQKRIGQSGKELKKVLDAYEFNEIATQVPGLEIYQVFAEVLNTIVTIFGQCSGCPQDGGPPQCAIRYGCREKGYRTCAECSSVPSEKQKPLLDSYPQLGADLKESKKSGLEKWTQGQQEKVDKGLRYADVLSKK